MRWRIISIVRDIFSMKEDVDRAIPFLVPIFARNERSALADGPSSPEEEIPKGTTRIPCSFS
jgi:hypothetical protein